MTDSFKFDPNEAFGENLESFLNEAEKIDKEMADILRDNINSLKNVVVNQTRNTQFRSEFNNGVVKALDELLLKEIEEPSE